VNRDLPITFMDSDDQEREYLIQEYGQNMLNAYAAGDRLTAGQWMELQAEAIKGRSAGQVARMEADYFGECGERDRKAIAADK